MWHYLDAVSIETIQFNQRLSSLVRWAIATDTLTLLICLNQNHMPPKHVELWVCSKLPLKSCWEITDGSISCSSWGCWADSTAVWFVYFFCPKVELQELSMVSSSTYLACLGSQNKSTPLLPCSHWIVITRNLVFLYPSEVVVFHIFCIVYVVISLPLQWHREPLGYPIPDVLATLKGRGVPLYNYKCTQLGSGFKTGSNLGWIPPWAVQRKSLMVSGV